MLRMRRGFASVWDYRAVSELAAAGAPRMTAGAAETKCSASLKDSWRPSQTNRFVVENTRSLRNTRPHS